MGAEKPGRLCQGYLLRDTRMGRRLRVDDSSMRRSCKGLHRVISGVALSSPSSPSRMKKACAWRVVNDAP